MKTRRLMAIMPHKYGTRHLIAGDEYEASASHALALVFSKRAHYADEPATLIPATQPHPVAVKITDAAKLEALRMEALRLGVAIDGRWGMARLQQEIAEARR